MSAPKCLACRENWLVRIQDYPVVICPSCSTTVDIDKIVNYEEELDDE